MSKVGVVDARGSRGLNLTFVRDGIISTPVSLAATLEGQIALGRLHRYINHDIDDALRAGIITPMDRLRNYFKHGHQSNALIPWLRCN